MQAQLILPRHSRDRTIGASHTQPRILPAWLLASTGSVTSNSAMLSVITSGGTYSRYNLTGFATVSPGTTGGGEIAETNLAYAKVTTPLELASAVLSFNKGTGIKVIEIMNDLNLGWN